MSAGKGGRPPSEECKLATALAREYGVSRKSVRTLGTERLMAMSEEARALLLGIAREGAAKLKDGIDEPGTAERRARRGKTVQAWRAVELAEKARIA